MSHLTIVPVAPMPIALPKRYLEARRKLGGSELHLDESKLARRRRPIWPGMIYLYKAEMARRETARVRSLFDPAWADRLLVIGSNTAGLSFTLDDEGRIGLLDDCALGDDPTPFCASFDELERAFVATKAGKDQLARKEQSAKLRADR